MNYKTSTNQTASGQGLRGKGTVACRASPSVAYPWVVLLVVQAVELMWSAVAGLTLAESHRRFVRFRCNQLKLGISFTIYILLIAA